MSVGVIDEPAHTKPSPMATTASVLHYAPISALLFLKRSCDAPHRSGDFCSGNQVCIVVSLALYLSNTFWKNECLQLSSSLHKANLSRQSIPSRALSAVCLCGSRTGEASDGDIAAVRAGAVVRNSHRRRRVRCEAC